MTTLPAFPDSALRDDVRRASALGDGVGREPHRDARRAGLDAVPQRVPEREGRRERGDPGLRRAERPAEEIRLAPPSLNTTTARAPAAIAFSTFTRKKHEPRCTSATAPSGNAAKSDASHALVEAFVRGLGTSRSTATTRPSTRPLPEYASVA